MNCNNCGYGLKQSSGDFEKILCTYEEGECVKITELEKEIAELKEQNTNLQEMLKTERSVTCKEEYLKKVTELEQENAELRLKLEALDGETPWKDIKDKSEVVGQLTKAKEIIKKMLYVSCNSDVLVQYPNCSKVLQSRVEAEQFLKGSEVEK